MTTINTSMRSAAARPPAGAPSEAPQRVPPQSIQSEACVLGSMILHHPAIDLVVQIVRAEQFYRPAHQTIFQVLVEMSQARKPIDLVTLRD